MCTIRRAEERRHLIERDSKGQRTLFVGESLGLEAVCILSMLSWMITVCIMMHRRVLYLYCPGVGNIETL